MTSPTRADWKTKRGWSVATHGAAALALGAGIASPESAEADVVYMNPEPDIVINNELFPWDVDGDGTPDFGIGHIAGTANPSSFAAADIQGYNGPNGYNGLNGVVG